MKHDEVREKERPAADDERLLEKEAAARLNATVDENELKGRFTKVLFFSALAAAFGSSFVFGYNIGAKNASARVIKEWIANDSCVALTGSPCTKAQLTFIWSWIVGIYPLGGVFGSLLVAYVADKFGRKGAMLMNNALCIAGGLIMAFSKLANAWPMLLLGRFIIGVNCGLNTALAPMYLTEIAPVNLRGLLGSANQLAITIGILLANVFGLRQFWGTSEMWPVILAFTIVPAIYQLIALPFCPESPSYLLIMKRQRIEAEKALKRLRQKSDVSAELQVMQEEADKIASVPRVKFGDMFKAPLLRWALTIAVAMHLAMQLGGINAAMFFSQYIFEDVANLSQDEAGGGTIAMCLIFVGMTVISTLLVDRLGRRILMLAGMVGMFFCTIGIVVCLHFVELDKLAYKNVGYGVIAFLLLFVVSFATGPGSIPWFYVSELFDEGARGYANAIAIMTNWLASFLVGLTFTPLTETVKEYSFLMFTFFLSVFWLFIFLFAPETRGRHFEDIQKELKKKAPGHPRT